MTKYAKMTLLGTALAAFLLPVAAQDSNAPATSSGPAAATAPAQTTQTHPNRRAENQQDRIANGIANGSLVSGEVNSLEKKEKAINQEERDMKAMDNGHLTAADRATLQQQQNQLSKQIYKDKHNSDSQPADPKSEFGKRRENQQDRIAQGVKSGQLTPGETSQLDQRESQISREVRQDRAANGGHLTAAERAQVNRQQNQLSKQIHQDKHNRKHQ